MSERVQDGPRVRDERPWRGARPDLGHPALLAGAALQVVLLVVLRLVWSGRWSSLDDVPAWAELVGPATAVPLLLGALVAAWRPRPGRGGTRGHPATLLRALQHLGVVLGVGLVVALVGAFSDTTEWSGVLVLTAGLGTIALVLVVLLAGIGPLGMLAALREEVHRPRAVDRLAAVSVLPLVAVWASVGLWAVPDESERGRSLLPVLAVVAGQDPLAEPGRAWVLRLVTVLLVAAAVRFSVLAGRLRRR